MGVNMRKGVTLIELIVALSIIGLVFIAGTTIYSFGVKSYQINSELVELSEQSELIKTRLSQEIRQSGNGLIEISELENINARWKDGKMKEITLALDTYAYSRDSHTPQLVKVQYKLVPLLDEIDKYKLIRINENGNSEIIIDKLIQGEGELGQKMLSITKSNYNTINVNFTVLGDFAQKTINETITVRGR